MRAAQLEAAGLVGLGLLLFFATVLAVEFTRFEALTAIWPTNALALVVLLRNRWTAGSFARVLSVMWMALAAPLMLGGAPIWAVLVISLANLLEIALAYWLVRRWLGANPAVTGLGGLSKFIVAAALLAPAVAATIMAPAFLVLPDNPEGQTLVGVWLDSWTADGLGMMLIAPFGLAWKTSDVLAMRLRSRIEGLALWVLIAAAVTLIFGHESLLGRSTPGDQAGDILFLVLLTPLLVLASLRFGVVGAAIAALTVTGVALAFTISGHGPIAELTGLTAQHKVYWLQLYLAVVGLSTLPVAAVLRDRDRYASELSRQQRRAEAASDGKSRLLANVSHEIKSPIGGIIGIGELWSAGKLGPITPMQEEMADMLVRTARQIEALAYDLLDVARAESGAVSVNMRPVELLGIVEDVKRACAVKPEAAGLKWTIDAPAKPVLATADSVRLAQVLTNLVTNAVKYGGSGGVVILRLSQPSPQVARVEVIDKGPGISLEKQTELFEPFNRLGMEKSTIEGHGIGLALARRLAELQGGSLGVESEPGEGARFWVDLKAAEG